MSNEKIAHLIELNLPAHLHAPLPNPDKTPVTIDGVPFKHVKSVTVTCGNPNELTTVAVEFYAEVMGTIGAEKLIETARDELEPVK